MTQIAPIGLAGTLSWIAAAADQPAAPGSAPALPRFRLLAYTGGPMRLAGWRHPVVVDLAGLQIPSQQRPIRLGHDASQGVGHTDAIAVENGQLIAAGVVSRDTPAARDVVTSGRNGFPWQASIGASADEHEFVKAGEQVVVNGRPVAGPVNVVRKATLGEISFVDLGADGNTTATVAAQAADHTPGVPMTPKSIAAIIAAHPAHAALIAQRLDAGDDEPAIAAAIAAADQVAVVAERDQLKAALAQAGTDHAAALKAQADQHAAAIAAKDADLAKLTAERDQLNAKLGIKAGAPADPGPGASETVLRRGAMSRADKAAYIKQHGADAFHKLPA